MNQFLSFVSFSGNSNNSNGSGDDNAGVKLAADMHGSR